MMIPPHPSRQSDLTGGIRNGNRNPARNPARWFGGESMGHGIRNDYERDYERDYDQRQKGNQNEAAVADSRVRSRQSAGVG